jgi:hypothetical protein
MRRVERGPLEIRCATLFMEVKHFCPAPRNLCPKTTATFLAYRAPMYQLPLRSRRCCLSHDFSSPFTVGCRSPFTCILSALGYTTSTDLAEVTSRHQLIHHGDSGRSGLGGQPQSPSVPTAAFDGILSMSAMLPLEPPVTEAAPPCGNTPVALSETAAATACSRIRFLRSTATGPP